MSMWLKIQQHWRGLYDIHEKGGTKCNIIAIKENHIRHMEDLTIWKHRSGS
jgi:hypothetical protein